MRKQIEKPDGRDTLKISFDDTPEIRDQIFHKLLDFFNEIGYIGECIVQSDTVYTESAEFFADLADDILKFEVEYIEDES